MLIPPPLTRNGICSLCKWECYSQTIGFVDPVTKRRRSHLDLNLSGRYDPSTGIYGMDFFVVLERPGYRVGRRRRCKSRVGIQHRVTKEDAMKWFQVKYEGVILNKAQAGG